jgi:8-amino-7-oxononanoate synthase
MAAAAIQALEIVRTAPEQRVILLDRAAALRERLQQQGWSTGSSGSQIIPVYLGCPRKTTDMAGALRERGLLVPGIRPPTVPRGESLLRVSLSTAHTDAMIDQLLEGLVRSAGSISRG